MADYRLPMDADGVKYHGTVDQNEENPGQFMYGLDENGNKRIIRTDEQGNVLTRVTGSIVEDIIFKDEEITAGSYVDYNYIDFVSEKVRIAVRASFPDFGSENIEVKVEAFNLSIGARSMSALETVVKINGGYRGSGIYDPVTTAGRIRVLNTGDADTKLALISITQILG